MIAEGFDLYMTRGDTETLTVTVTQDESGTETAFDFAQAVMTVRIGSRTGDVLFEIDATSIEGGVAVFDFPPELTEDLDAGKYVYDIQLTTAAGEVKTPIGGSAKPAKFVLWQDVTYDD